MQSLPSELRPSRHVYEPQPGTNECAHCGLACDPFGLTTEPAFPDPSQEIPSCPTCTHWAHDKGPCGVVVVRWPQQKSCQCKESAA